MSDTPTPTNYIAALSAPFPPGAVKQRTQGGRQLDYLSIDATLNRVNEVLGTNWGIESAKWEIVDGNAVVEVFVQLGGGDPFGERGLYKRMWGIGADKITNDLDKSLKTALAEAIKKAFHQVGVGLYLWDEAERANVQEGRQAASGNLQALKNQVFKVALKQGLTEQTPAGIAKHFGISDDDLQDAAKLTAILREAGVL